MKGFSGGQYSVLRVVLGLVLLALLMRGLYYGDGSTYFASSGHAESRNRVVALYLEVRPWLASPWGIFLQYALAVCLAVYFTLGQSVPTVVVLLIAWCVFSVVPSRLTGWSLNFTITLSLILHVGLAGRPYGSLAARGRPDPGGGWHMTTSWLRKTWALLAIGYLGYGTALATNRDWVDGSALQRIFQHAKAKGGQVADFALALPTGLLHALTWMVLAGFFLFAPLILSAKTRPWIWCWIALVHVGSLYMFDSPETWELSIALLFAHAIVFDPSWIRARSPKGQGTEVLYYDGECGLCHGAVRFVLAEDLAGRFQLAPLQSEAFLRATANLDRSSLPDSVLIQTGDGTWLSKGRAVRHLLGRLGGPWRMLGGLLGLLPGRLLDFGYDCIAKVRRRIFAKPKALCPLVPPDLGRRFLA